ncbi:RES family NAD+ phosphorylase [Rathayibacter agropyri]|nr:RES family NAD+ phosphorylase [Rathayibacter agropyri]
MLWRVGRASDPARFATVDPIDASTSTAGNRFDVPGGAVLYAATEPSGAYAETISRFRPTSRMRALAHDPAYMLPGSVPADWRLNRKLIEITLNDPAPFLDVENPETHAHLNQAMVKQLAVLGVDNLDVSHVRGADRLVTRAIALFAYTHMSDDGGLSYSGIRYVSKLGDHECWAVFDGTESDVTRRKAVDKTDPDLLRVASTFGLVVH